MARTYLVDMEPGGEDAVLASRRSLPRCRAARPRHPRLPARHDFSVDRWTELVREVVARHGRHLGRSRSPTNPTCRSWTARSPSSSTRSIHGVLAAKDEARRRELEVDIGFGSVPQSPVALPHVLDGPRAPLGPGTSRCRRLRRPQLLRRRVRENRWRCRPIPPGSSRCCTTCAHRDLPSRRTSGSADPGHRERVAHRDQPAHRRGPDRRAPGRRSSTPIVRTVHASRASSA